MHHSGIGNVRVGQLQSPKLFQPQPFQMLQANVGDLGIIEAQRFELRQSLQMLQSSIGDFGIAEDQPLELGSRPSGGTSVQQSPAP